MMGHAEVTSSLFDGLGLLQPERYISFLYRGWPEVLEADMARVKTEHTFHKLLRTALFERDRLTFECLHPTEDCAVVITGVPYAVPAIDRLLSLGYATRVLVLPSPMGSSDMGSSELEAERKDALLLWVCRQPSIRDGLKGIGAASRHAIVIAYSGGSANGLAEGLFRPAELAARGLKALAIVPLTSFHQDAFQDYTADCEAHGVDIVLSPLRDGDVALPAKVGFPRPAPGKGSVAKILLVGDNQIILRVLTSTLSDPQYEVSCVADGEEALRMARALLPDLMVLDAGLPKRNGFVLCRTLKSDPATSRIAIIMLTALASESHRRKALEAGADEFLTKPFIPMALLDRVRGLLAARPRSGASLPGHGQEQARLQFVNALCHELRTPLTPVLASAGVLREVLHPEPKSMEARLLNNILAGAENLRTRIDELLDVAAFQSGAYRLNLTRFDSMALLKETCAFLEPEAARRGQRIIADIADTLPQLRADRARLQQVLLNLVTNAMKFSPEGGAIEVRAAVQNQSLTFEVEDHGMGLSPEEQARLFQPYFRGEQDRQRFPGLGLRVALCRQIVEAHGGGMWVETGAGVGNSFRFSLPLGRVRSVGKKRRGGS